MKSIILAGSMALLAMTANADSLTVKSFRYYGPVELQLPLMVDTVDVAGKPFDLSSTDAAPTRLSPKGKSQILENPVTAPGCDSAPALHTLSFDFENTGYTTPVLDVEGLTDYALYVDGVKTDPVKMPPLRPMTHSVALRYVTRPGMGSDSLKVMIKSESEAGLTLRTDGHRRYNLLDVLDGTNVTGCSISPDGRFAIATYVTTLPGGASQSCYRVIRLADGATTNETAEWIAWMPTGAEYYCLRPGENGREMIATDAATGRRHTVATGIPGEASVSVTPDGQSLILTTRQQGRKENPDVYQVLEPEDRQPGWRNRSSLSRLDIASGIVTPLTFGHRNTTLQDISDDSRRLLIMVSESRLEERPTTVFSLYVLDLTTMRADTLVSRDGFITRAAFSPDGRSVLVAGSPESLGGIGKNVPEGRIPSMTDGQLFIIDASTGDARALTRDFNPSVNDFAWSRADGKVYLTAEDRGYVNLFCLDPASGRITRIATPEEVVGSFSVADRGNMMVWMGESVSSPRSLYSLDTRSLRSTCLDTPKAQMLADVQLGICEPWSFVNSRGDTIEGRFYLPPDFDASKRYPMIVNYYGGCSPTSRNFETRYPHNAYAAQGYVVYVINPSGATGFGQEFSSRHVNTAGRMVADDIIEGTRRFCHEHAYVDSTKIGCIGASYGGFMTQYLTTLTDLFAAAISHAGISDHTSYWGEGYWGYSYSEVSMAESYPWSDRDLYVDQSPLYRADRIHTPLLFLHGDKDNNVPVGESIQMFTALKLLGRPTAFVAVADQDHHILDYNKRIRWQDTIFAWMARYLKDDPSWWDALYQPTPL